MSFLKVRCSLAPVGHARDSMFAHAATGITVCAAGRPAGLRYNAPRQLLLATVCSAALTLSGCSSVPLSSPATSSHANTQRQAPSSRTASALPALPPAGSGRGAYYMDDGPGDNPPPGLLDMSDAEPRVEPYSTRANRPYTVFGKRYTPFTHDKPFKQRGIGSWYGKKFHGQKTSSGELYDMYKMTAAHPTMPIPSYARVTSVDTGVQIIVRVNDRGPFVGNRIIDLSYTAALKLGYLSRGSGLLEVERLLPDEIERIVKNKRSSGESHSSAPLTPSVAHAAVATADHGGVETIAVATVADAVTIQPALLHMPTPPVVIASGSGIPAATGAAFYLQLGAFSQGDNARAARERLQQQWAGSLPPLEVIETGALHRLFSGPFASRDAATLAAQQVQDAGIAKPVIVQR